MAAGTGENTGHVRYTPRAGPAGMVTVTELGGFRERYLITTGKTPSSAGALPVPLRELMDDRLLDALLERSKDEAGGCG
jgi:hypothetical protein